MLFIKVNLFLRSSNLFLPVRIFEILLITYNEHGEIGSEPTLARA